MPRSFEGDLNAEGLRFGVVASRFNDEIVSGLLAGAVDCLRRHGADDDHIDIYRVPGAFEIPQAVNRVKADAVVAVGALIRGETPHFDVLAAQVTNELSRIAVEREIPVAFGVLTCNTHEQAAARSGPGPSKKGWEAALAAIEMANLWRVLRTRKD